MMEWGLVRVVLTADVHLDPEEVQVVAELHLVCPVVVGHNEGHVAGIG